MKTWISCLAFFALLSTISAQYVSRNGIQFELNGKRHFVSGTNYWQAMYLGMKNENGGHRDRLIKDLDALKTMGVNNLRVIAASEGPDTEPFRCKPALMSAPGEYNEAVFEGLDFFMNEIAKRGMKAVMVLNNQWQWSGGFAQYVAWAENSTIPYPPSHPDYKQDHSYEEFVNYGNRFYYNPVTKQWFKNHIKTVLERRNTINGKLYKNDEAVFAWQLGNEPRNAKTEWIGEFAGYIKSIDSNHMVSTGTEGHEGPDRFVEVHKDPNIDYTTVHVWVENFQWYNPQDGSEKHLEEAIQKARERYWEMEWYSREKLNKPLVFEEYGLARDAHRGDKYSPLTTTFNRDKYYATILGDVEWAMRNNRSLAGQNFWAYTGLGRPDKIKELGYLGDPAHEPPNWYGVLDKDSTVALIKSHGARVQQLMQ
ncbi:glycoside hydrolase superfamily [Paraphysoderma sedebokerense]|nr:glycoside hydrolase superfamily [Paraphysoderma sedebokerense]